MSADAKKTLRRLVPQWQEGNNPANHFGGRLLSWLAPAPTGPVVEVGVAPPTGTVLPTEVGIVGRSALLAPSQG